MVRAKRKTRFSDRRYLFDLLVRIILGTFFAFSAGTCLRSSFLQLQGADLLKLDAHQMGRALSILTIALYSLMVAFLFILRLRPVSKFAGVMPAAAAILGSFSLSGVLWLTPRDDLPLWVQLTACGLVICGNGLAVVILTHLGRSFSILPESRRLVVRGPYAYIRHPLYVAEAIVTFGTMINFFSLWAVLLVVTQFALQFVRMHFEEKVLRRTFPEYKKYARHTARLIPGIY
jgi:protein-S-isoprenylcysteine O-methyltransferase Ste14